MLHKALLSSPKEFRVSIGTQNYCTASVNKSSVMPGDLVTVTVRAHTGYGNTQVGVSPSVQVTKVNETTFTFVMPFTDVVVSASASALDFRINVSKTGEGTVTVKSLAKYGETVTISLSPGGRYELKSISVSDASISGSGNTRTFSMPARDVTVFVTFEEVVVYMTVRNKQRSYGYSHSWQSKEISHIPYWGDTPLTSLFAGEAGRNDSGNRTYAVAVSPNHVIATVHTSSSSKSFRNLDAHASNGDYYTFMAGLSGQRVRVTFSPLPDRYGPGEST